MVLSARKGIDWSKILGRLAFALAPVIVCFLFALIQGVRLWELDPLTSTANDELFYFKQVEAIVRYGMPLGYYGYNGSTAALGTFGAWGIFPLLPYVPFVWLAAQPSVMLWANLCLVFVSFLLFHRLASPGPWQSLWLLLCFCALPSIQCYTLAFGVETLYFSGCVIMAGLTVWFTKNDARGLRLWGFYALVLYLALCRPYYAVFALLPGYFQCRASVKKGLLSFAAFTALFLLLYLGLASRLQAAYFFPIIDTQLLAALRDGGIGAFLRCALGTLAGSIRSALEYMTSLLKSGGDAPSLWGVGSFYAAMAIAALVSFAGMLRGLVKKRGAAAGDCVFQVELLCVLAALAIVLAIFEFYTAGAGSRHLIAITLFLAFVDIMLLPPARPAPRQAAAVLLLLGGLALNQWRASGNVRLFHLPNREDAPELHQAVTEAMPVLAGSMEISPERSRWDNTVMLAFQELSFTYGYGLPAGTGIQLPMDYWLYANAETVSARYILGGIEPSMMERLTEAGWTVVAQGAEYVLYERPGA